MPNMVLLEPKAWLSLSQGPEASHMLSTCSMVEAQPGTTAVQTMFPQLSPHLHGHSRLSAGVPDGDQHSIRAIFTVSTLGCVSAGVMGAWQGISADSDVSSSREGGMAQGESNTKQKPPLSCCFLLPRNVLTLLLFIARAFISGGFQAAYVYTPEVGEVPESGRG